MNRVGGGRGLHRGTGVSKLDSAACLTLSPRAKNYIFPFSPIPYLTRNDVYKKQACQSYSHIS